MVSTSTHATRPSTGPSRPEPRWLVDEENRVNCRQPTLPHAPGGRLAYDAKIPEGNRSYIGRIQEIAKMGGGARTVDTPAFNGGPKMPKHLAETRRLPAAVVSVLWLALVVTPAF